jgi:hypothetical protein
VRCAGAVPDTDDAGTGENVRPCEIRTLGIAVSIERCDDPMTTLIAMTIRRP